MKIVSSIWHQHKKTVILILLVALVLRLIVLGITAPYNSELNDQKIFEITTEYFFEGKDLYAANIEQVESPFRTQLIRNYPYGPMPTYLFSALTILGKLIHVKFAILLRLFHISIDLLLLLLVFVVAVRHNLNAKLIGFLYAINPVTILITAYHGQLDVLTIFFAFLAMYVLLFSNNKNKHLSAGILLGLSIAIKMFTIILWPWFVKEIKGTKERIMFTLLSGLPFALTVLSVMTPDNLSRVIKQVLLYGGAGSSGGIVLTLKALGGISGLQLFTLLGSWYSGFGKYVLLIGLAVVFVYFARRFKLLHGITLFFLVTMMLAPSLGVQYFVWFLPFFLVSRFFRLWQFAVQLGILTVTMGLFYFYHGVGIGAFASMGITPDLKPLFLSLFTLFMWLAWTGFGWMAVQAIVLTKNVKGGQDARK